VFICFQHEEASTEMFEHLLNENNLRPVFAKYKLGESDILFIKEQIAGPCKDRRDQVNVFLTVYI
jgi:deoxynucleoside triphosphate triphosphohydrolase SAMHD1